eukprot:15480849-Alexandrium_andersonii.AAC.1
MLGDSSARAGIYRLLPRRFSGRLEFLLMQVSLRYPPPLCAHRWALLIETDRQAASNCQRAFSDCLGST